MALQGNWPLEWGFGFSGEGLSQGAYECDGRPSQVGRNSPASDGVPVSKGQVRMRLHWPWSPSEEEVNRERAETNLSRGKMLENLITLERERNALDEMVRRSLDLLEMKK